MNNGIKLKKYDSVSVSDVRMKIIFAGTNI